MKVTVKRPFLFKNQIVVEGDEIETTDIHGKELIQSGLASGSDPEPTPEPTPKQTTGSGKGKK